MEIDGNITEPLNPEAKRLGVSVKDKAGILAATKSQASKYA